MTTTHLPERFTKEYVLASRRAFDENRHRLDEAWDRLLIEHEGECVGSNDGSFLFGKTPEEVATAARERGWTLRVTVIDHLVRERPTLLL